MSDEPHQSNESTLEFAPDLATAMSARYAARHRFQIEPMRLHQDDYNAATDELGHAFSQWQAEQPELFEQLRFWLNAYPEG